MGTTGVHIDSTTVKWDETFYQCLWILHDKITFNLYYIVYIIVIFRKIWSIIEFLDVERGCEDVFEMVPHSWLKKAVSNVQQHSIVCYPMHFSDKKMKSLIRQCKALDDQLVSGSFQHFRCMIRCTDGELLDQYTFCCSMYKHIWYILWISYLCIYVSLSNMFTILLINQTSMSGADES